jgi:hypothetical protein
LTILSTAENFATLSNSCSIEKCSSVIANNYIKLYDASLTIVIRIGISKAEIK